MLKIRLEFSDFHEQHILWLTSMLYVLIIKFHILILLKINGLHLNKFVPLSRLFICIVFFLMEYRTIKTNWNVRTNIRKKKLYIRRQNK